MATAIATPTLTIKHPRDDAYGKNRAAMLREVRGLNTKEIEQKLWHDLQSAPPAYGDSEVDMSRKMVREIRALMDDPYFNGVVPDRLKAILDSTSGTTGSVLIRQDLEPLLYQLFVTRFPAWERMKKKPANGLVHAFNQITQAASGSSLFGTVLSGELSNVSFVRSNFVRQTASVAVFATGRGSSFKELAAVNSCRLAA